ncbi:MAG: cytochrome bd-I oxidase subunit CydX [Pseudoxanthomonas sp.]
MWYFSWILGVSLAAFFAILNGMWFELREQDRHAGNERMPSPPHEH